MSKVKLSIVIVQYGNEKRLFECIKSVYKNKPKTTFEVIIVDNNKTSVLKKLPNEVTYIKSSHNLGYGAGNNLGVSKAKGEYVLILNPDVDIKKSAIDKMVDFLDKNEYVAAVSPILINELETGTGTKILTPVRTIFAHSFINKIFPKNPITRDYKLEDIDKSKPYEVGCLPGSVFMIKKNIFIKIGKFDKNIFLYYEEADLGKRIANAGYIQYVLPNAKASHCNNPQTHNQKLIDHNTKSRKYYIRKNYGFLWMIFVEMFCQFSKWHFLLTLILSLSAFLRLYMVYETFNFAGDISWYFLEAKNMIQTKSIPLIGIASSVPVLAQGALWTWILALFLYFGNFEPIYAVIGTSILGVINILIFWSIFSKDFSKLHVLFSSFVLAVSPFVVHNDRATFVNTALFLFVLLFSVFLFRFLKSSNYPSLFMSGIFLGLGYQVELAAFILFPIIVVYLLLFEKTKFGRCMLYLVSGFLIAITPLFIYDINNGVFIQTVGFGVWFVSKFVDLFGFSSINLLSLNNQAQGVFTKIIFPNIYISISILSMTLFSAVYALFHKDSVKRFLALWLCLGFLGFLIRGSFSDAYMPVIYIPIAFFIGEVLYLFVSRYKYIGILILVGYFLPNIYKSIELSFAKNDISIVQRNEVAKIITRDANRRDFAIYYVGPNDQYKSGDSQWRYLLWKNGNQPVDNSDLGVIIAETPDLLPMSYNYERVYDFGKIKVAYLK